MKKFLSVISFLAAMTISIAAYATSSNSSSGPRPIFLDSCKHCGICADTCPVGAIIKGDPYTVDKKECVGCFACMDECPEGAGGFRLVLFRMLSAKS